MAKIRIKRFKSSSGLEILVGQDDLSNDYLTFRVASQKDFWFHVSGRPGSHVVLKTQGAGADRESLKEAAALAVYFSKMRQGGKVSVAYCSIKDVTKPKGAPAGQVRIKNEKKLKSGAELLEELEWDAAE